MARNSPIVYDTDLRVAELYDQTETSVDDIALIQTLIGKRGPLRVLEPFCGTGRILIPLALAGHTLVGLDHSRAMMARAQSKVQQLPVGIQDRILLVEADVTRAEWPQGFDLVILGGNCFYELATAEEQERCIISAAEALKPGGAVYLDNDHMEGELDESWREPGVTKAFPRGVCSDGSRLEGWIETIWHDAPARLVRFRRRTELTLPDGEIVEKEYVQQKHPVSKGEVESWLIAHGFVVEEIYGARDGTPYTGESERAIFWARRR